MNEDKKQALLEADLARNLDWVRAAESRLGLVLTLSTAMVGTLAAVAPPANGWVWVEATMATIASALLLLGLVFVAVSAFPRISGPDGSLLFFGGIASMRRDEYIQAVSDRTDESHMKDLMEQCHRNAKIAERKFTWLKRSMVCLLLSVFPWAATLYLLYAGGS